MYSISIYKLCTEYSVSYEGKKCCLISFICKISQKGEKEQTNKAFANNNG